MPKARAKFEEAFKSLREGGPSLPVGDMPPMGYRSVTQENEAASAALFRTKGIREERIGENLNDYEYPPEDVARAKMKWAQLSSDPEWLKRCYGGGALEYDQWLCAGLSGTRD